MIYTYESVMAAFKKHGSVEVLETEPVCPMRVDSQCSSVAGHCETGNKQKCEQTLKIYLDERSIYQFRVFFVYPVNSLFGGIDVSDIMIVQMIKKGIIDSKDLQIIK